MRKVFSIMVLVLIFLSIISYAEVLSGKFVRLTGNSVIIKTETDILNLPVSKDLLVLDSKGERVSSASLFENANVTVNYQDGVVKSITIDKENKNYNIQNTENRPEYQLLYSDPTHQYRQFQGPAKVSYFGYLPVDYQSIYSPMVDLYKVNYYSYNPVYYSSIEGSPITNQINFYNNLLANNYMSERYYYEVASSVTESQVPNYYYIAKMQEKSNYYYKINPTEQNNTYYYANNSSNLQSVANTTTLTNSALIRGKLVEINNNMLVVVSDRNYQVELNDSSSIFVKKNGKIGLLSNKEELKNLLNKNIELSISSNNNKLVANTIVIEAQ